MRREEGRKFIREYKLAHGCIDCGYNKCAEALEFDHKPGFSGRPITSMSHYLPASILKEIEKCEVRCANCHKRKTFERGQFHRSPGGS
jgi:hypothetical protein